MESMHLLQETTEKVCNANIMSLDFNVLAV